MAFTGTTEIYGTKKLVAFVPSVSVRHFLNLSPPFDFAQPILEIY